MDVPPTVVAILTSPQGQAAVAEGDTGALLRTVRRGCGLRQADLAKLAGYSQATVSRAEVGQIQDLMVIQDLADALQIPRQVFSTLAESTIDGPTVEDVERRELLKAALTVASAAILPAVVADSGNGTRVSASAVDDCWRTLGRLHALEIQHGGAAVYELTAGVAKRLRTTVATATYGATIGQRLREVTAATMIQAGWQAYDARRRDLARHWWLETLHLADLGKGNDDARVSALASLSREATDNEPHRGNDAVGLAQAAAKTGSVTPRMRSLLAAREALGHAASHNRRAAASCLHQAHRYLDRGQHSDDPAWLAFWGSSDLALHEMHAARLAGDLATAEHAAREAVRHADAKAMPRNHAIYVAHLGSTLARSGKYDETITISQKLLGNSITDGSYRVRAELHHTARMLSATAYKPARDFAATVQHLVPAR